MNLSMKQKFVLLTAVVALTGLAIGKSAVGAYTELMERPYSFTGREDVRRDPSVLAPLVYNYYAEGEGQVLDKLVMEQPTAGRMKLSREVELNDGVRCFLGQGDVYKISAEKAEPGKCYVNVKKFSGRRLQRACKPRGYYAC